MGQIPSSSEESIDPQTSVGSPSAPSAVTANADKGSNTGASSQFTPHGMESIQCIEEMLGQLSEADFRKLVMKKLGMGSEQDQASLVQSAMTARHEPTSGGNPEKSEGEDAKDQEGDTSSSESEEEQEPQQGNQNSQGQSQDQESTLANLRKADKYTRNMR